MEFRILKRSEINTEKWDDCVLNSHKPLIYAQSWFLDACTKRHWDALVWEDYQAVMPLPYNRKWIKKQIFTPHTIQQLGLFALSNTMPPIGIDNLFTRYIRVSYAVNNETELKTALPIKRLKNLILPLNQDYDTLFKHYSKDRRKLIRQCGPLVLREISVDQFAAFYKEHAHFLKRSKMKIPEILTILKTAKLQEALLCLGIYSDNDLVGVQAGFKDKQRFYLSHLALSSRGYKENAYAYLVNELVKHHANTDKIIDFRGSSIPSIYNYNKRFGAQIEPYNVLTFQKRWLKALKS